MFLPTGILTTVMPVLQGILTNFATQLTEFENYETQASYDTAMTEKIFILNFITSYLPIFLTAFVYVPFGSIIVPYLDVFSLTVKPFAENEKQLQAPQAGFAINPARLRKQVIYFTVTAQVVNMAMEIVVPYLKRKGTNKYKAYQSDRAAKKGGATPSASANDPPEEAAFLARIRQEAMLDTYDVTSDLREMVLQYGYLALFSAVWPLVGASFLANDWLELRADALKICVEMRRPTPHRADTIGPWLDSLAFLTWLGSLTAAALVYMFAGSDSGPDGTPGAITGWALLLSVFCAEHAFLAVRFAVRKALAKLDSPGRQKERRERYLVRRRYFDESLAGLGERAAARLGAEAKDREKEYSRAALEEDAREASKGAAGPEGRFWARQRGWRETAVVGRGLIERAGPAEGKGAGRNETEGKKEL